MANADANVHMPDMLRTVTLCVNLTGQVEYKLRLRIGLFLIRIGVRITGCGYEYELNGLTPDA